MDPFTQKLLEKTRQRREQLHNRFQQSTPQSQAKKRNPLQTDTSVENVPDEPVKQNDCEEKRRKSSPKLESVTQSQRSESKENEVAASPIEENRPATRKGRLQMLAAQINNWEDDLSHPQPVKSDSPEKKPVKVTDPVDPVGSTGASKPPKPPRTFQEETPASNRRSPRLQKEISSSVTDAFTFGSASSKAKVTPSRPANPPTVKDSTPQVSESNRKHSDDEPTQKAVSDRFSMWEKRAGDALTPLRQATPLRGAKANTPAVVPGSATKGSFTAGSASSQAKAAEFRPEQDTRGRSRRRSRSAAPTPERERTGVSAPWQKPVSSAVSEQTPARNSDKSAARDSSAENEWSRKQDDAFTKAPMSARKCAWEAKIAEQQKVTTEHNRVMYRTRSATRLPDTPCQKQQAEDQLRQGQEKAHDPAEKDRRARQAELSNLQNRFNHNGLLQSETGVSPMPAAKENISVAKPLASSVESLEDQYFTASDSEVPVVSSSNNATAGSSGEEKRASKRQVSFKSPMRTVERQRSNSPQSEKVKRRSSCKLPTLGYDSSSDEEMTPNMKLFPVDHDRVSPSKIPRLGDESSVDSFDGMRQVSGSSIGSSVSSYSYHFVASGQYSECSRDVVDFLDEAMSDDEISPEPVRHQPVMEPPKRIDESPRRQTRSSSKASPGAVFSIDQYRQKTKSVARLPADAFRTNSVYDTDDSAMSEETSSSSTGLSDSDRRRRVKELQELVKQEQNVIGQASNALNQCCKTGSSFAGSTEQVECNRLLLIACQRRQAYLCEIERIKSNPQGYPQRKGKGSLTISNIQLPLKHDFVKKIGTAEDDTVHYFLLMVRAGPQVIVTQMVSTHDALMRGTLTFPNLIKLNDIMNDFRYELEVYGMQISRETSKQSAKKDKKYKSTSISRSREASQSGSGSSVRTTNFTHITSLVLTMDSVHQTSFKLSRVPYLSPLHGTMHMTLRCTMEANIVFKGFINMFEDVGGFGAWHRRWCVLANNCIHYWKYPDDEKTKEPIGELALKNCVTSVVGLVSRDKCARPNTIELVITRPATKSDVANGRQVKDRLVYDQYWFGMDTKIDRLEWCEKLNEALANVRQWYSDAARPVASKRTVI
ncbi:anillin-like isoform X2 [Watersipora subatra]|uniref:anillin-like isoform X2 n=1 Tax=Watersipora subatra TaxID=2589382 RepID=UPI00355BEBA7